LLNGDQVRGLNHFSRWICSLFIYELVAIAAKPVFI